MVDHVKQYRETAIMIEAAFGVCKQGSNRRCTVNVIGSAICWNDSMQTSEGV